MRENRHILRMTPVVQAIERTIELFAKVRFLLPGVSRKGESAIRVAARLEAHRRIEFYAEKSVFRHRFLDDVEGSWTFRAPDRPQGIERDIAMRWDGQFERQLPHQLDLFLKRRRRLIVKPVIVVDESGRGQDEAAAGVVIKRKVFSWRCFRGNR